jgi:hypothetical protein
MITFDDICFGISGFQCIHELPRLMESLPKEVLKIYIDGRYALFDWPSDHSTDGSVEYMVKQPNTVILEYSGFQPDKRQQYLDLAGVYKKKFLIVIDTDEFIHKDYSDWPLFLENLTKISEKHPDEHIFKMKVFMDKKWTRAFNKHVRRGYFRNYVRIHKDPGRQKYVGASHFIWANKDYTDEMLMTDPVKYQVYLGRHTIDGVRMGTDSALRSKEFLKSRDRWAFHNIHEERRRLYNLIAIHRYKLPPNQSTVQDKVYWLYDKDGVPLRDKQGNAIVSK